MRNSRFIELLNLYVDQQLSVDDAAELEKEVAANESRRRTYNQYCRMQKACALLFEHERSAAPSTRVLSLSLLEADKKIQRPHSQIAFERLLYPVGLAAAVCLALAIANRPEKKVVSEFAVSESSPPAAISRVETYSSPEAKPVSLKDVASAPRINLLSVFAGKGVAASLVDDNSGDLVVETGEVNSGVSSNWMRDLELAPIEPLTERITLKPISTTFESRNLGSRRANGQSSESAAFQFQR